MINTSISGQVENAVVDAAMRIIQKKAEELRRNLLYEISVANTELAFDGAGERYGFNQLSDVYADSICVEPVVINGTSVSAKLVIKMSEIKNIDDKEADFFRKYVLGNVLRNSRQ